MKLETGLRYAWRRAAKQRGLTLVLIFALALGLGGATAMISLARHVVLNPLGLPQPERVVHIYAGSDPATAANYSKLTAFAAVGGFQSGGLTVTAGALQRHEYVASVTQGFFDVARIGPRQGRRFSAGELDSGARVAIISQALQSNGFEGAAIGRSLQIGGMDFTVIGVMPARFDFPAGTSVWVPFNTARRYLVLQGGPLHGELMARLRPGANLTQAEAQVKTEMEREVAALETANPGQKYGMSSAFAGSSVKLWARASRPTVDLLLTAAGLLWLVACFGCGGVLLARALDDQKELATRIALGGRRLGLAFQWANEGLIVVVPAATVGVGVATALMALLRRGAPTSMLGVDLLHASGTDWATLAALAAVALALIAFPPALSALRLRPPAEMLQAAYYGKVRTSALWPVLVVIELAAALVLTAGAALLLSSYTGLTRVDLGFQPQGVSAVTYTTAPRLLPLAAQARSASPGEREAIQAQMAIQAQAGDADVLTAAQRVAAGHAALVESVPLSPAGVGGTYVLPAPGDWGHQAGIELNQIAGPYLQTLGLPLLGGRYFSPDDTATAPAVAIVSRTAAQALWGVRNPIGRELYVGGNPKPIRVVGETTTVSAAGASDRHFWKGQVYFPATQPWRSPAMTMSVVARGVAATALTQAVSQVHGIELLDSTTLDADAARILAPQRFSLRIMEMFSVLALLLIWLSVIGMLTHWVAGRRREIAIRLALGASPAAMARTVLLRLGAMLAAAIGLGLLLSPLERTIVGHLLVGVGALDLRLWAAAALIVALVALAAAAIPALRAARSQPADTLRYE